MMPKITFEIDPHDADLLLYCTREEVIKTDSPGTQQRIRSLRGKVAEMLASYIDNMVVNGGEGQMIQHAQGVQNL